MNYDQILLQCNSISDLREAVKDFNTTQKGAAFALFVKYYLKTEPDAVTSLQKVWLEKDLPGKIRKELNHPAGDEGIDLFALTKTGEYWSIQAKFFQDPSKSLGRQKLGTFYELSANICKGISHTLACTTANSYSKKLDEFGGISKAFICNGTWEDMPSQRWTDIHDHIKGKQVRPKKLSPRKHQADAIKAGVKHFVKNDESRGKGILPCGAGKSLIAYWLKEKFNPKLTIVAVPSLFLVRQTIKVWTEQTLANKKNISWIAVCSDDTIESESKDHNFSTTQELGIQVTSDIEKITDWLKSNPGEEQVVFTTYQSGEVISEAARKAGVTFDVGIMDEAHKTTGASDSLFAHLLDEDNIKITKRVFLTATERVYKGSKDDCYSMDDKNVYGDAFYFLSYADALKMKPRFLTDYRILTIDVTDEEIADLLEHNEIVSMKGLGPDIQSRMAASQIAFRKAAAKYPINHAISFHSSLDKARRFKGLHNEMTGVGADDISADFISGSMSTAARNRLIRDFVDEPRALLTNARCLTEGVDVPAIDAVMFADPKNSTVDIVQALGRAMRVFDGKDMGYVIVPIEVEVDEDGNEKPKDHSFRDLWRLIRELSRQDSRIVDEIKDRAEKQKRYCGPLAEIENSLSLTSDHQQFIEHINIQTWDRLGKLNWRTFDDARKFIHKLQLKNEDEWLKYSNNMLEGFEPKPADIPKTPRRVYKNKGWTSMGDWIGTYFIAKRLRPRRAFGEARAFAHDLNLNSQAEWFSYCKGELPDHEPKPIDIPGSPQNAYQNEGWTSWGDFLGTNRPGPKNFEFLSYEKAREFVLRLNLKSQKDWQKYCRGELEKAARPHYIPSSPAGVYKNNGWISWHHWLGLTNSNATEASYFTFEEARAVVRSLNLKSTKEWFSEWKKTWKSVKENTIPRNADQAYKDDGWQGWGDFLGTGTLRPEDRVHRTFTEAREFARSLGLKSKDEWASYCKGEPHGLPPKPIDIPAGARKVYLNKGWQGWSDFLGTEHLKSKPLKKWRPFEEAREFARKLNLKNQKEWQKYAANKMPDKGPRPDDIPSMPQKTYADKGWKGLKDWLGTSDKHFPNITKR